MTLTRNRRVTPVVAQTTTPAPVAATVVKKIDVREIEEGDVFSEISHYVFTGKEGINYGFKHLEGDTGVTLDKKYVESLLQSADQYHEEKVVGREDKFWTQKQLDALSAEQLQTLNNPRVGDLKERGIRSIWGNIHSAQVLAVCFDKQAKALTQKRVNELLLEQATNAAEIVETAKRNKKSLVDANLEAIRYMQANPVSAYENPEERVLRGYKTQFESLNGYYDVIDMDLPAPNNVRKVNINEIKWLGYNGVKYIVEK